MEALIAQQCGCLFDCFEWESNYCALHWCSLIGWRVSCHHALHKEKNILKARIQCFSMLV